MVAAFIVAFVLPYLLNAIGAKIGWLFGGIAIFAAIYSFLFVPETKVLSSRIRLSDVANATVQNRSLEEMDELFAVSALSYLVTKIVRTDSETWYRHVYRHASSAPLKRLVPLEGESLSRPQAITFTGY